MKNNKSIDGLTTHAVKKPASSPAKTAKKVVKKEAKPAPKAKEITIVADTSTVKVKTSSNKPVDTQTVEDFLKPVQAFDFDGESGELKESKGTKSKEKTDKTIDKKLAKAEKKLAKKEAKAGKKSHKVRNIIASIVLIIVLALIGFIIWAVTWGNDIIAKITGGQGNIFDVLTFMDDNYEPLKTDSNGRTNILAIGTSGYNMEGDEGNGTHDGAQLTDSIMAISLNQDTGDILMISFPRDLKASRTCTATGKINEIYWCNGGGNPEKEAEANQAIMNEVGSILGIDFQYYAHLNWGSLQSIVDILGGITIKLDEDIRDYYYTEAVYDAGVEYQINGDQAVGLARARHGTTGGDFSRGNSQQKILIGIKNKLIDADLSIAQYMDLATALGDNLRTNFNVSELKTLAHLSYLFNLDSMRQANLFDPANGIYLMKTANINGISYVIPSAGVGNYSAIQNYVKPLLDNDPRTYEQPRIAILNATDTSGVAAEQKAKLEEEGYTITTIDNIEGNFEDECTLYNLTSRTPGTISLLEKSLGVGTKTDIPENIPRDYDIVIVLGPSSGSASEEVSE